MSPRPSAATLRKTPAGLAARGFTLVELMVAMALGLLLLSALISLVVSTVTSRSELDKSSRQIENGRYALQVLSEDIEAAGFLGNAGTQAWARQPQVACAANTANLGYSSGASPTLPLAVQLLPATPAPTCLDNAKPGTGMLLLTRVSSQALAPTSTSVSATETYVQVSTCASDTTQLVADTGTSSSFSLMQKDCSSTNLAPLRKAIQRIYYISTCNDCSKDTIPTLKMAEFTNGGMTNIPLVDGIEDLQFEFGIDTDGNGSPDCYVSNPANPDATQISAAVCPPPTPAYVWTNATTNWTNVMTVRVNLLARNTEATGGWKDDRTYALGLAKPSTGPFNDGYKRHAFSAVARLNNPSGLRELP